MAQFYKVETRSDWGYFDSIGGKDLVDGELVEVAWPDGTIESHTIKIDERGYDSGRDGFIPDRRARVEVLHHGAWGRFEFRGSDILVRREET